MHSPNQPNGAETLLASNAGKPEARKARRISDAALVLLSHAANRADGMVLPPPAALRARGSALTVLLVNLLERKLVREIEVDGELHSWRVDEAGCRVGLQISGLGLHAIGIPPDAAPDSVPNDSVAIEADLLRETSGDTVTVRPNDPDPILPADPVSLDPSPRRPSKQNQIVELLSQDGGASIDLLMAAMNWLPHTVRAALSGLRKKGHAISRDRSDDGRSIYRIDAAAAEPTPVDIRN